MVECFEKYRFLTPLGHFKTVFFSDQECGEVDPKFVRKFNHDLPRTWKIMNYYYLEHIVSFNKDDTYPMMTRGWNEMKEAFDFNHQQAITLSYFGDGLFGMTVSTYHGEEQIPKFHSRSIHENSVGVFFIRLSEDTINKPYLSIWCEFEDFVRANHFTSITAYNDNGSRTLFQIARTDEPFQITAIGVGWNQYCTLNEFEAGDAICFNFNSIMENDAAVRVFKFRY